MGELFEYGVDGPLLGAQDRLERLYLSAGLGTLRYTPGGAGGSSWGEECLGFPAETAAPATRTRVSGRRRDEKRQAKL